MGKNGDLKTFDKTGSRRLVRISLTEPGWQDAPSQQGFKGSPGVKAWTNQADSWPLGGDKPSVITIPASWVGVFPMSSLIGLTPARNPSVRTKTEVT